MHNLTDAGASIAVLLGAWAYSVWGCMWASRYIISTWELDETSRALEAHVVLRETMSLEAVEPIKARLKAHLVEHFHIGHSTLEFETPEAECSDPQC